MARVLALASVILNKLNVHLEPRPRFLPFLQINPSFMENLSLATLLGTPCMYPVLNRIAGDPVCMLLLLLLFVLLFLLLLLPL